MQSVINRFNFLNQSSEIVVITVRQLHAIIGMSWDEEYYSKVTMQFHEIDGGISHELSFFTGVWHCRIKLNEPIKTAHLPYCLIFKSNDFKILYRAVKKGYRDLDFILPLQLTDDGIVVLKGPGKGILIPSVRK